MLDDERNDIYIHIDSKSVYNPMILNVCRKSKVIMTERVRVNWGGYSVVKATMVLLKAAVKNGPYEYYHLLSGTDLPLKSQNEIHDFFDRNYGKEFISVRPCDQMERVMYYYFAQDCFSRDSIIGKIIKKTMRKISLSIQRIIGIDRTKKSKFKKWGIGSQFFDITDSFARYLLKKEALIYKTFRFGFLVDEVFIQTVFLNSPYNRRGTRYVNLEEHGHEFIGDIFIDIKRAIDFKRGTPYVYGMNDYKMLIESGCLFARKFDERDYRLIQMINDQVMSG